MERVSFFRDGPSVGTFSNHLTRLRCNKKSLTTEWLYFCLRELWLSGYFAANCTEFIGQSAFNKDKLVEVEIPIPPLEEQKRIVARIEDLMKRVEQASGLRKKAMNEIELLSKQSSKRIFENTIDTRKLSELTKRITKGESPRWQGFSYQDSGPLFVRSENVLWGKMDYSYSNHIPDEFHQQLIRSQLKQGDVLINLVGASIGRACTSTGGFR